MSKEVEEGLVLVEQIEQILNDNRLEISDLKSTISGLLKYINHPVYACLECGYLSTMFEVYSDAENDTVCLECGIVGSFNPVEVE